MKEIRLVVKEKRVFVPCDESKLIAQIGNFFLLQFYFKEHKKELPNICSSKTNICSIENLTEKLGL